MKPELLHILQHSLGCDQYGQSPKTHTPRDEGDGRGIYYRNHFVSGPYSNDHIRCMELLDMGLMRKCRPRPGFVGGEDDVFYCTPAGMAAMREHSPKPPKITRAQQRYRDWREADIGWTFKEYLRFRSSEEGRKHYAFA